MGDGFGDSFDVFFSYHWRDHAAVEAVARTLTERGLRVFLDRWYLTPGQPWPQALERTLACCNSVAVFLGADGLGPWQQRERDLALDRQGREPGFPVIPVLLTRGDPALGFLQLNTWVDLSSNLADQAALDFLCAAVRREPPGPPGRQQLAAVKAEICPYRGLRPFREEDAAFFCGREAFTQQLIQAVERTSLVAVVGASGIGKSSVVHAGLFPRLRQTKAGRVWEIATLVPTDRPLHSLAAALVPILEPKITRVDRLAEINKLAGHLAEGTVALRDVAADVLRTQPGTDRLLLFVDQWEELYTLVVDDGARRRFLAEILDASEKGPVTVVLTLRGDFFGQALSDRSFADRLQGALVNLGPMTEEELERSITEPAEKAGLHFEPGLVDRMLADVGQEPGNLPLLEFVLAALWEHRQGITLHHDAYERMDGVQGAIAARADAEFAKLDAAQKDVARHMLIQMVRPGEGTEDTRQRAVLPAGNATALTVIRRLADARLVVTARDPASGAETVEVTHEALIRHWTLLHTWVEQDREFLRSKARLEAAAVLWEQDKRDSSRLLPAGRPLAEGEKILASRRGDLGASVIAFIEASAAVAARTRRYKLLTRVGVLGAVMLVLGGGYLYWLLFLAEHREYYNAFAKRWGVFEGVARVRADEAEHRSRTLRFVRKGRLGPVTRVDAIDGSGGCARAGLQETLIGASDPFATWDSPTRPCSVAWERDSKGRVSKHTILDATGRVLGSLVYTDADACTADFHAEKGHLLSIGEVTTITYERIKDGPNRGQDRLERYTDAFGQPKPFPTGAFSTRAEYNAQGLLVHAVFLGQDGEPIRSRVGFAAMRISYDDTGSPVDVSLFDENGQPAPNTVGVARWTMTYDARGNMVEQAYFDQTGKPTRNKEGYAKLTLAYSAGGKEIKRAYFDEVGKPTRNEEGYAKLAREFDSHGWPVKEAYFGEEGKPTLCKAGYAAVIKQYDGAGNLVEEAYFDEVGKPTRNKEGYAKVARAYDTRGEVLEEAYFDRAGKSTRSKNGCAKRTLTYDHRGLQVGEAYFDEAGKPTLSKEGYATLTKQYDGVGHQVGEAYFDEAGKPTLSKEGYAKRTTTYDDQGNEAKVAYFDEAGKPTLTKSGFASVVFDYDERGNMVRRNYYDKAGKPTLAKDHYTGLTRTYDARGNVIEEAYFDQEGKPCLEANGVARAVFRYDERGNQVEQAHFDEAGKPTLTKSGFASVAFDHDARGNMVRRNYYDKAGKPTLAKDHYTGLTRTYDARVNVIEEAYFDEAGKPTALRGYTKITLVYDARGNQIENRYFDEESKPTRSENGYSRLTQAFDERDNLTEQAFFDEGGKPTRSKDGFAKVTKGYDARGNEVAVAYFDELGRPMRLSAGYATFTKAYDVRGNRIGLAYYDEEGKPIRSKDGYASMTSTYDARDNEVEGAYYDEAGRPTPDTNGVVRWTAAYDPRGNVVKASVFDETGRPTRLKDGYATITKAYDVCGNRIGEAYYDEEGNPIRSKDGYASTTSTYDARDNMVEQAYFDENGQPTPSEKGYAKVTKAYDVRGNVVEEAYFDEKGNPTQSKEGYAKITKVYNSRSEVVEQAYFDEKGIAVPQARGTTDASPAATVTP